MDEFLGVIQTESDPPGIDNQRWVDLIRQHIPPEEKVYTWWSYRAHDWQLSNRGRRLDHIWTTPDLARRSQGIEILREARGWKQPSDHVPVMATLDLS